MPLPNEIVIQLLNAVSDASTLILIALGLAIIFGMMGVINFAHGEFIMLGAYVELEGVHAGLGFVPSMLLAPLVVGAIGIGVERGIIRHLYGRPIDTLLATWGLSLTIIQIVTIIFGPVTAFAVGVPVGSVDILGLSYSGYRLFLMGMTVALLVIVYALFQFTKWGLRARATLQNPRMASVLGVRVANIYMLTFAMGAALAGIAGALLSPLVGVLPTLGASFIAKAFMVVIVGGPSVLVGPPLAGIVLGFTESNVAFVTTNFFGAAALLVLAVLILRILPHGITGYRRR